MSELVISEPVRLFVGVSPDGLDAESCMVLEYSLRQHATIPVEIVWMRLSKDPESFWYSDPDKGLGWNTSMWATPFSGFRWAIPAYCNFKGKAVYCDSDFVFLSDIKKLWEQPFEPGKAVMAKADPANWRYCLAFWNCQQAEKHILPIERLRSQPESHRRMMNYFANNRDIVQKFDGNWNSVDGDGLPVDQIDALHYSDMGTQLHLKYTLDRLKTQGKKHWFDDITFEHPRKDLIVLFDTYYDKALESGINIEDYVPQEVYGNIKKESQAGYQGNQVTR